MCSTFYIVFLVGWNANIYLFLTYKIPLLHHKNSPSCYRPQLSPLQKAQAESTRRWACWSQEVFQTHPTVPCWGCQGGKNIWIFFAYMVAKMLNTWKTFEGSFSVKSDEFNPKQIALTLAMKAPPSTEELMKAPSRFAMKPKTTENSPK